MFMARISATLAVFNGSRVEVIRPGIMQFEYSSLSLSVKGLNTRIHSLTLF